jgi:hypothetical protein
LPRNFRSVTGTANVLVTRPANNADADAGLILAAELGDPATTQDVTRTIAHNLAVGLAANTTVRSPNNNRARRGNATGLVAGSRRPSRNNINQKKDKALRSKRKCKSFCSRSNYVGTTGRTVHARMTEHHDDIQRLNTKNALTKHMLESHPDKILEPDFTMSVLTTHMNNVERYITESLFIEKQVEHLSVNKRSEWGKERGIVRLTAARC